MNVDMIEGLVEEMFEDNYLEHQEEQGEEVVEISIEDKKEDKPKQVLKPLPPHLKYVFLGEAEALPVIINSSLNMDEEARLIEVLKAHKTALGWTIEDIKGLPWRSLSQTLRRCSLSLAKPQSSLLPPWFSTRRVAVSLSEVVAPPSPSPSLVAPPSATFSIRSTVELKQQGIQEERLQLLVNVTGAFRPGVLTTLVGVSGAGKTTLMDVLAGRKTGGVVKCSRSAGHAGKPAVRWTEIQSWFEDRLQDLPDDPNNELMIPEDPECNKEGELS
ncbi:ABC transporter G family member 41-like [Arachis ipaensis]|uniref:ABC transporter G family member 41-like n=1 Tax=Arachis ipaensis TaxID=130454 RepID=UPI000A2B7405|nr:ABC transporter G family member 41-like [Arachis ipaensis]